MMWASLTTEILAGLAILGVMDRTVRKVYRWVRRLTETIESTHTRSAQLEHNGGSSLRDDVTHVVKAVAELQSTVEAQGRQILELQTQRRSWF